MSSISQIKKRFFPRGVRRDLLKYISFLINRVDSSKLAAGFSRLGIPDGSVICVHAMLSGLGYISGGPGAVVPALLKAVKDCTIMMPSFPFDGTTDKHLEADPVYDRDSTPSKSGLLSETLRTTMGAVRSLHPTHPSVALGRKAELLIEGSENSPTPFGDESTYGRFSKREDAVLLLVHTNNSSIVHRIQEMVDMPNLFLESNFPAKGLIPGGGLKTYPVRVHRPVLPLYVCVPGECRGSVEFMWLPDYCILFPEYNRVRILNKLQSKKAKALIEERHRFFIKNGVYRTTKINSAEILAVKVRTWIDKITHDLAESVSTYKNEYSLEKMTQAMNAGLLTKF